MVRINHRTWILLAALGVFGAIGFYVAYHRGRSLWHPLWVRLVSGSSRVEDRLREIERAQPELVGQTFSGLTLIAYKDPGALEVWREGRLWESHPFTARSGKPGPKRQQGDGQIPEGIYTVAGLNPDSSYHLSLRVSYPNADDQERARAAGIVDPGGDIYIHGKDASIGCIAIGDRAIERVFYAAAKCGGTIPIVIAPCRNPSQAATYAANRALYDGLAAKIAALTRLTRSAP